MATVLTDSGVSEVSGSVENGSLWLDAAALESLTGWVLKPEGLCRGDVCVPLPAGRDAIVRDGQINASAVWKRIDSPVVTTTDEDVWYLGESSTARASRLRSLEAPDFTLPDLAGELHSLSDHRGKKVFLATWASW